MFRHVFLFNVLANFNRFYNSMFQVMYYSTKLFGFVSSLLSAAATDIFFLRRYHCRAWWQKGWQSFNNDSVKTTSCYSNNKAVTLVWEVCLVEGASLHLHRRCLMRGCLSFLTNNWDNGDTWPTVLFILTSVYLWECQVVWCLLGQHHNLRTWSDIQTPSPPVRNLSCSPACPWGPGQESDHL